MEFADEVAGGNANAEIQGNRITIEKWNRNPVRALFGHEITHRIQELSADSYAEYKAAVQEVMGDRWTLELEATKALADQYGISYSEDQLADEVAADYAGELLQNDGTLEQFIQSAQSKPTLLQRIAQVFRDLVNKLRGTEKAQAERALGKLEKAYRSAVEAEKSGARSDDSGVKYAIGKTTDNKPFVEVEQDILAGVPEADWVKIVKENLKQKFPNGITVGNNEIQIDGRSRQEMTFSRYMQWLYNNDPQLHADKLRATNNADEILHATTGWVNEGLNHPRKDRITDFARGHVLLRVGGNDYAADVVVGTKKNGSMALYDVLNLQPTSFTEKETDAAISTNPSPGAARSTASVSADNVTETGENVKRNLSLKGQGANDALVEKLTRQVRDGKITMEQALEQVRQDAADRTTAAELRSRKQLEQENDRLRERVSALKAQMKPTEQKTVRKADTDRVSREILKAYDSEADAESIRDQVKALGDYLVESGGGDEGVSWEGLMARALPLGREIVENARVLNDDMAKEYADLRSYLRETKLVISEQDSHDMTDYNATRKALMGTVSLRKGENGNIEAVYADMAARWPEFFNTEAITHPAEMVEHIREVMDAIKPSYENPHSANLDYAAEMAAQDVIERILGPDVRQSPETYVTREEFSRLAAAVAEMSAEKTEPKKEANKNESSV